MVHDRWARVYFSALLLVVVFNMHLRFQMKPLGCTDDAIGEMHSRTGTCRNEGGPMIGRGVDGGWPKEGGLIPAPSPFILAMCQFS